LTYPALQKGGYVVPIMARVRFTTCPCVLSEDRYGDVVPG